MREWAWRLFGTYYVIFAFRASAVWFLEKLTLNGI